jgi:hypothetical protein
LYCQVDPEALRCLLSRLQPSAANPQEQLNFPIPPGTDRPNQIFRHRISAER